MVRDMTTGSVTKNILMFCLPLLLGNVCQELYNMVDTAVVGQGVGWDALAAVGSTGSLSFLVIGFVLGVCSGLAIPVSQCFGAEDYRKMRGYIANSLYIGAAVGGLVTLLTVMFTKDLLTVMGTPEDIADKAYSYIIIIFSGAYATLFYNFFAANLRAVGDSRTPLYFLIFSTFLNIAGDVAFVIFLGLGVRGAAYATVLAQTVSGLCCLVFIFRKVKILIPHGDEWKPDRELILTLVRYGLPMGFQFSITAIGSVILQSAVNSLGSVAVASMTTGYKLQLIVMMPMETLGITMATYCGQNKGAGRVDRIKAGIKSGLIMEVSYCAAVGLLMATVGHLLTYIFVSDDAWRIIDNVHTFLMISGSFYIPLGCIFLFRNSLQGIGHSVEAMGAGLLELVGRSVVAVLLVPAVGFAGACFASPAAWMLADLLLIPLYIVKIRKLEARTAARSV